jgi:hypothetical protein
MSTHLRSEISDRHGSAPRVEDTIGPGVARVMQSDSESRCGVADGVADYFGRPIRPVAAKSGSPARSAADSACRLHTSAPRRHGVAGARRRFVPSCPLRRSSQRPGRGVVRALRRTRHRAAAARAGRPLPARATVLPPIVAGAEAPILDRQAAGLCTGRGRKSRLARGSIRTPTGPRGGGTGSVAHCHPSHHLSHRLSGPVRRLNLAAVAGVCLQVLLPSRVEPPQRLTTLAQFDPSGKDSIALARKLWCS